MKLLTLPFRIIGALLKFIVSAILAIVLPVAAIGGSGYLGYKYLKKNPEQASKLKDLAISKVKNAF